MGRGKAKPIDNDKVNTFLALLAGNDVTEPSKPEDDDKLPLYYYQEDGKDFIVNKKRCILADQMGLGKTLQALAAVKEFDETNTCPVLIVSPKGAKPVWKNEIKKWLKSEDIFVVDSLEGWNTVGHHFVYPKARFVICNFEQFREFHEHIMRFPWKYILVDEAHKLRNTSTKLYAAAEKVFNHFRYTPAVFLTGTPLINTPADLWALLHLLYPDRFPSKQRFLESWFVITSYSRSSKAFRHRNVDKFQQFMEEFMLRRLAKDVIDLPAVKYIEVPVELEGAQRKYYEDMRDMFMASFGDEQSCLVTVLIAQIMRLKQICLAPELVLPDVECCEGQKTEVLTDLLEEITGKVVICSGFKSYLNALKKHLESLGYVVGIITGDIAENDSIKRDGTVTKEGRETMVRRFQDPNDPMSIFLLASKAGGESITLTEASTFIYMDKPWTAAEEDQAFGRVYRIGQDKKVFKYYLKTVDTIEDYIDEVIDRKRQMFTSSVPVSLIRKMLFGKGA